MSSAARGACSCLLLALLAYLLCFRGYDRSLALTNVPTPAIRQSVFRKILSEAHYFIPAVDHKLNYVGRWTPTSNRLRWDTSLPGAYIDLIVRNASIIYVSLFNAPTSNTAATDDESKVRRVVLTPVEAKDKVEGPVTLTILLCNGNVLQFAHSENGLLAVNINASSNEADCPVRISYTGGPSAAAGTLQFQGVWLPRGASLQPRSRILVAEEATSGSTPGSDTAIPDQYRKTIELLTDFPEDRNKTVYEPEWLDQVAAHFNIDHVKIPAHSHCLTEVCLKKRDSQYSTQDVFFRSGPASFDLAMNPWDFRHYVPDLLIFNLGAVDQQYSPRSTSQSDRQIELIDSHQSIESFTNTVVNSYTALIHQIRRTAYPLHPSALDSYSLEGDGYTYNSAPSTLPIFVMRPFDGSLEQATLTVVEQMQREGDKSVFWIDTNGWLSEADYVVNKEDNGARWITAIGHAKIASFMQAHLCHYLAPTPEQCPFLRRDNYLGKVYVPVEAELDKAVEESKVKKLSDLFWT